MTNLPYSTALIFGAGPGISASLARLLIAANIRVGLVARRPQRVAELAASLGAVPFAANVASQAEVADVFTKAEASIGIPDIVIYNASARVAGPLTELDAEAVRQSLEISAYGGFLVLQQAARRMVPRGHGAILLTGASASVKGFARSAPFAMGKFALRGLAQSAARELGPQGIHVAHIVIDGGVRSVQRPDPTDRPDSLLDPDAIAETYMSLLRQPRSAWSLEVELRPWVEKF